MMNQSCFTFRQKLFRSNDNFSEKTFVQITIFRKTLFGQMIFRSNDHFSVKAFGHKNYRSNDNFLKKGSGQMNFRSYVISVI
jgi:hypothetical protein